jgi:DNA-binding transcriptional MerR regulator
MAKIIESYLTEAIAEMAGVPVQNIYYWRNKGLIRPSVENPKGRGRTLRWSLADAIAVRMIGELREAGLSLQAVGVAVEKLKTIKGVEDPLPCCYLISDGDDAYLAVNKKTLVSILRQPGQLIMKFVFDVGRATAVIRDKVFEIKTADESKKKKGAKVIQAGAA